MGEIKIKKLRIFVLLCAAAVLLQGFAGAIGLASPIDNEWKFQEPTGICVGEDGVLLVTDGQMNNIAALSGKSGALVAGRTLPYVAGSADGGYLDAQAELALFSRPFAVASWNGGLAVSDRGNNCLRFIIDGQVRTLAGSKNAGYRDGGANAAAFDLPMGLAVDEAGLLYIADAGNGAIRTLDAKGQVKTLLGGLCEPVGLCWYDGGLYIADAGSHQILLEKDGKLSVVAGTSQQDGDGYIGGFRDGSAENAEFSYPYGLLVRDGVIYVADTGNSAVRMIEDGWVSTLAFYSGSGGSVWPGAPSSLAAVGDTLYAADYFAGCVLQFPADRQLFSDVSVDAWYARAVSYVCTAGCAQGVSATRFDPDGMVTKAQLATMLHRIAGKPTAEGEYPADVKAASYYAEAARWSVEQGIASADPSGRFDPDARLTREQAVTMLYRYALCAGMADEAAAELTDFADAAQVSEAAQTAVGWAVREGILLGSGGKLLPGESVTRAQTSAMLTRFFT